MNLMISICVFVCKKELYTLSLKVFLRASLWKAYIGASGKKLNLNHAHMYIYNYCAMKMRWFAVFASSVVTINRCQKMWVTVVHVSLCMWDCVFVFVYEYVCLLRTLGIIYTSLPHCMRMRLLLMTCRRPYAFLCVCVSYYSGIAIF